MRKDDGIATLPPSGPWIVTPPPRPQGILCVIVRLPPRPPATSCNLAIVQSCNLASIWWLHLQSCNLTTRSNLAFFPTCSLKWFTVCPLSYTNHYGDDVQDLPWWSSSPCWKNDDVKHFCWQYHNASMNLLEKRCTPTISRIILYRPRHLCSRWVRRLTWIPKSCNLAILQSYNRRCFSQLPTSSPILRLPPRPPPQDM